MRRETHIAQTVTRTDTFRLCLLPSFTSLFLYSNTSWC